MVLRLRRLLHLSDLSDGISAATGLGFHPGVIGAVTCQSDSSAESSIIWC